MTCPACTERQSNSFHGIYYANCEGCKARQSEIARPLHLVHLKRTPGAKDRKAYIECVERVEGKEAAELLKREFLEWCGHK